MGIQGHGVSYARDAIRLPVGFSYNLDKELNITNIRANADGLIEVETEAGAITRFDANKGEKLDLQGRIGITTNTNVDVQVYGVSLYEYAVWLDSGLGDIANPWNDSDIWSE